MTKIIIPFWVLLLVQISASAQSLSGTVRDSGGSAIAGATVYLLNTNFITSTNGKGEFRINKIPAGDYNARISAVGFATIINQVKITTSTKPINIKLTESDRQLDEVVVVAQKRDDQAQKLPVSLSVFSAKQIEDGKIWNIKDITGLVPGLYSASPGDNRNVTSIRGITTTSYDPAVATYIDGVNQFGLDTYIAQLLDVDHIEVLSGPQGTLYGRNATGGVINVITKQPTNQISGFVGLDFGNYDLQRYSLGFKAPLIKDKLFLGVAGIYSNFGGYYTNAFNNTKFDKQHYFLGNYYLKYLASSKLSVTLNVKNDENRNNGPFPLASDPVSALTSPFIVNQNATTKMIDNLFNASLSINYTGNDFIFNSQSSYQKNKRYYVDPIDGDFSPIDGVSLINNYGSNWNTTQTGIQEFRFSSPAQSKSPIKWTGGAYGFYNYAPTKQGTHFGADAQLVGAPMTDFTSININTATNYGIAFYGQATYTITPQLDVTAGLRYDYEHKKQFIQGSFQPDNQPAVITRSDTSSTAAFKALSPKVSVAWHMTDDNNLYAAYNRGFRAGGISQLGSDPIGQPPLYDYKPEYSNNFEVGTKNTFWDKRIRLNVAVFYILVNDAQVPTLVLPDAITITQNAGKLKSEGAELQFASTPLKGLEFDYNFGYTHARYTSLNIPVNGNVMDLNGNHQIFTPDVTSATALQYSYHLGGQQKTKLVVRGEWRYLGDQYFDLANTIEQKGYSIFNGRVGVSTKRFDVFLWGSNIFNKHYIDYAYDFGASHLGNPQTYGVSLRTNF